MKNKFLGIIYDPVKARVMYDFIVSVVVIYLIGVISSFFFKQTINFVNLLIFPISYSLISYLYGTYGKYKLVSTVKKSLIISYSALTAFALSYIFIPSLLPVLLLTTFFTTLICFLPRWFTNLPHQKVKSEHINILISDNQPVLVVGGGGYIGSHVVNKIINNGDRVRIFDKFYYDRNLIKDLESNPKVSVVEGDISDLYSLNVALEGVKAVVHLAGIVGDPASSIDKNLTRHINIITTRMLKETVKAFHIPRFIFASSCSVYGSSEKIVDESSNLNPVSLYAQTKIDSERELLEDPFDAFHPTILRFATVFGHSRRMRFDLVANLFTAQAWENGVISVYGGNQYRPFIHVSDVANSIVTALTSSQELTSRQIYNVGDTKMNHTILELAKVVEKVVNKDRNENQTRIIINSEIDDPRNYNVSFDKIALKLDFTSKVNFTEGIREMHKYLKGKEYKGHYQDPVFSNYETTKLIQEDFKSKEYKEKHYTSLSSV